MRTIIFIWYLKLISPFLNAFLHFKFSEKHMLSEGGWMHFFQGARGVSGLIVGSVWLIVSRGGVEPGDKNLQSLDLQRLAHLHEGM